MLASFLVSLSWGSDHGLTTGEEAARRGYALGLLVLGPLALLTAFAAKHTCRGPAVFVPWVSLLAAAGVWAMI